MLIHKNILFHSVKVQKLVIVFVGPAAYPYL